MTSDAPPGKDPAAMRFVLSGMVQGVGMRPAVARLAHELQLTGFVRNDSNGVTLHVEGHADHLNDFAQRIENCLPSGAIISKVQSFSVAVERHLSFIIDRSSENELQMATAVPSDQAVCSACQAEALDAKDRRHQYAFISCTDCGPRYSVIKQMPFDRAATSMVSFPLCAACMVEYTSAADRRFHAQTTACPDCGPQLEFVDSTDGQVVSGSAAIERAAEAVRNGRILALKGIGGYQLVCDATSATAVGTLRKRKHRPRKPLAVMVGSVDEAAVYATLTDFDKSALSSPTNPIVLLPARVGTSLCDLIHPALQIVGMMLPTSPLHLWLLKLCGLPCVVTSGNVGGDPLVFRNEQATTELSGVADAWLHHNRDIIRAIDDSVVRCIDREQVTIRAARGIAPLSLALPNAPKLLATGGNQKVAIALSNGHQAALGPHIGDLNSLATRQRFIESVHQFSELYRLQPTAIAHDSHPDFFTTGWAASQTVPTISVQHHHAHVAAGMLEHGWLDREVLGVAFDGTGYGTDGTIWGGEFLLSTTMAFRRVAYFRTFPLPGGDRAIREPWRIALALIVEACGVDKAKNVLAWIRYADAFEPVAQYLGRTRLGHGKLQVATPAERSHTQNRLFPITSSVGRLFDGVASLLFRLEEASFEGEAAMRLEAVCDPNAVGEYEIPIVGTEPAILDWRPMVREIVRDMQAKAPMSDIATKFTRSIARSVATMCGLFPQHPVVLTGGCFQNQLLTELTAAMLAKHPASVGLPGRIPINDGGLAAGQLVIAAATRQSAAAQ